MDTEGFKITQLSFYNYGQKELKGSIMLHHSTSQNKMELILNAVDCSNIVNVIADRIAETIHEAARQFWVDAGMPMAEFGAQTAQAQIDGIEIPENAPPPAFGGEKED